MIGAVPPDYAATFFGVIDEDAVLAAVDAERVAEREELERDSRAELEGVDQAGEEVARMRKIRGLAELKPMIWFALASNHKSDPFSFFCTWYFCPL